MPAVTNSLVAIVQLLQSGKQDLAEYIEKVCDMVDKKDPAIQAVLTEPDRRARLLGEAAQLKERFPDPARRPPLWGIPVGVKDLFSVDGFQTRAGSQLPAEIFNTHEASFITSLRQKGALILGKTHMDEFAYCEPPPTRNPHNLAHTPGGSSGGSAAGVAAGMFPLAVGTQTTRSVIGPAAFCGVVGYKPTHGRLPTDGVVYLSPSIDTVGFFTSDMPGMRLVASLLVPDWQEGKANHKRPLLGIPSGIIQNYLNEEGREGYQKHLVQLEQAGYTLKEVPFFEDDYIEEIFNNAGAVLHAEMAGIQAGWFDHYTERYRSRTALAIERGRQTSQKALLEGRQTIHIFKEKITTLMHRTGIDLWVTPASGGPAPKGYEVTGWGGQTLPWSFAGLPCLTLPAGLSLQSRMPLGLQFIAPPFRDELLVVWADEIANIFNLRVVYKPYG